MHGNLHSNAIVPIPLFSIVNSDPSVTENDPLAIIWSIDHYTSTNNALNANEYHIFVQLNIANALHYLAWTAFTYMIYLILSHG